MLRKDHKVGAWCSLELANGSVDVDIACIKFSIKGREDFTPY